jgi:glutamate-1-semialdehyde 2,1-aminomutase
MAAALEVIRRLERNPITDEMGRRGAIIQDSVRMLAKQAGVEKHVVNLGRPQWSITKFYDHNNAESVALKSLFQQEFIKRGILTLGTHNLNATFSDSDAEYVVQAYREVIPILAEAIANNDAERRLEGSMIEVLFKVR